MELFGKKLEGVFEREKSKKASHRFKSNLKPYEKLIWEIDVRVMNYHDHIRRLENENWTREPSPQEVYSLLIDYHGYNLNNYYKRIAKSIIENDNGIFLSDVIGTNNNLLKIFDKYDSRNYIEILCPNQPKKDWYNPKHEIDISSIGSGKWTKIKKSPDEVVKYFFTLPYGQLPVEIQDNGVLLIPLEFDYYSLSTVNKNPYMISIVFENSLCSRGVREK